MCQILIEIFRKYDIESFRLELSQKTLVDEFTELPNLLIWIFFWGAAYSGSSLAGQKEQDRRRGKGKGGDDA